MLRGRSAGEYFGLWTMGYVFGYLKHVNVYIHTVYAVHHLFREYYIKENECKETRLYSFFFLAQKESITESIRNRIDKQESLWNRNR